MLASTAGAAGWRRAAERAPLLPRALAFAPAAAASAAGAEGLTNACQPGALACSRVDTAPPQNDSRLWWGWVQCNEWGRARGARCVRTGGSWRRRRCTGAQPYLPCLPPGFHDRDREAAWRRAAARAARAHVGATTMMVAVRRSRLAEPAHLGLSLEAPPPFPAPSPARHTRSAHTRVSHRAHPRRAPRAASAPLGEQERALGSVWGRLQRGRGAGGWAWLEVRAPGAPPGLVRPSWAVCARMQRSANAPASSPRPSNPAATACPPPALPGSQTALAACERHQQPVRTRPSPSAALSHTQPHPRQPQ